MGCMITSGTVNTSHEKEMTKQILVKSEETLMTKTPTLIPMEPIHDDKQRCARFPEILLSARYCGVCARWIFTL